MKTLGISMIVKDEAQIIETCLNSIKGADEIVIVDTGSKDNTIELCKKYTNKVYSYSGCNDWRGRLSDFSKARNKSLSYCTTDFVLIIDADETLEVPISQIKKIINEPWFDKHYAMSFIVETAMETLLSPRLLKRVDSIYYINAIHNLPSYYGSPDELKKYTYKSMFRIKSGYSPAHDLDPDRTLRILRRDLFWHRKNTRNMYYLAKEYINRKDVKKTVYWLTKYRKICYYDVSRWSNELSDVLFLLALCYSDSETFKDEWFKAVQFATESFNVLPTSTETAKLLKTLFNEAPGPTSDTKRQCYFTTKFWEIIEKNSQNTGVMMKRK